MAKGPFIRQDVMDIIARVREEHINDGWVAKEIQAEVAKIVQKKWPRKYKPGWPGLRAVQEKIVEITSILEESVEFRGLEKSWHLGTLKDFPIPTDALPKILEIQQSGKMLTRHRNVTVRQAIWIARLFTTVKDIDLLRRLAWHYALEEKINYLIGNKEFDTNEYDKLLLKPEDLLSVFEKKAQLFAQQNFKTYRDSFKQSTGIEMPGVSLAMYKVLLREGTAYAVGKADIEIEPGNTAENVDVIIKSLGTDNETLIALKKQGLIKKIKKLPTITDQVIVLKELVFIEIPANEWMQMQKNMGRYEK